MKRLALIAVLAVAACDDSGDSEDYPIEPGTDLDPGSRPPETTEGMFRGRVCVLSNLVNMNSCRQDNLEGFTVSIGGSTTTTDARGEFTVPQPSGSLLAFTVSGPTAVTTTTPF